jgi:hypothetical protein
MARLEPGCFLRSTIGDLKYSGEALIKLAEVEFLIPRRLKPGSFSWILRLATAKQAAEKRAEATSEAQEDVSPESEDPKEKTVRSPQTSFSAACKAMPFPTLPRWAHPFAVGGLHQSRARNVVLLDGARSAAGQRISVHAVVVSHI